MSNTVQGKFESSKNALTHGLTASNIDRFSDATRDSFRAYVAGLYEEWKPKTLTEQTYLERFAFNQFQLLRSQSLVENALTTLIENPEDEKAAKRHQNFVRHLRALERSTKEALHELRTMISDRMIETAQALTAGIDPLSLLTPYHMLSKFYKNQGQKRKPAEEVRFVELKDDMPPLVRELIAERNAKIGR